jgi:transposase
MIWQGEVLGLKNSETAANLGVDYSTDVQKRSCLQSTINRKLTPVTEYFIVYELLKRPGIMLCEIQAELVEQTGVSVSLSTICKFLQSTGFSRQRLRLAAIQRDDFLRCQFVSDVSMYESEMLVFLDETESD